MLTRALALIDAANRADPTVEDGTPAALLYGQRMTTELDRLFPAAPDVLRIAARGQHVERWLLPRAAFPVLSRPSCRAVARSKVQPSSTPFSTTMRRFDGRPSPSNGRDPPMRGRKGSSIRDRWAGRT